MGSLLERLSQAGPGNGIRFDRDGRMYVADLKKHNVFVFERGQPMERVYLLSDDFN